MHSQFQVLYVTHHVLPFLVQATPTPDILFATVGDAFTCGVSRQKLIYCKKGKDEPWTFVHGVVDFPTALMLDNTSTKLNLFARTPKNDLLQFYVQGEDWNVRTRRFKGIPKAKYTVKNGNIFATYMEGGERVEKWRSYVNPSVEWKSMDQLPGDAN